jgi:hypothetical protein
VSRPEPRRCVAPVDRYEIVTLSGPGLPTDVDATGYDTEEAAREMAHAHHAGEWEVREQAEETLCGRDAITERTVEGLVMPLCEEHAAELDAEGTN